MNNLLNNELDNELRKERVRDGIERLKDCRWPLHHDDALDIHYGLTDKGVKLLFGNGSEFNEEERKEMEIGDFRVGTAWDHQRTLWNWKRFLELIEQL